jgi:hypothetical protein
MLKHVRQIIGIDRVLARDTECHYAIINSLAPLIIAWCEIAKKNAHKKKSNLSLDMQMGKRNSG